LLKWVALVKPRFAAICAAVRSLCRVEEVGLEQHQGPLRTGQLTPLLDLPAPHPRPETGRHDMGGEVDGVPDRTAADGEQVMERGPRRDVQQAVAAGPGAQLAEREQLHRDGCGEAELRNSLSVLAITRHVRTRAGAALVPTVET
jgi:hypothetical protein